jgi:DNA-binding response OmpR family regulator
MPVGNGFDIMKTVREQNCKIIVIVLTNFATEINRKRSLEEKADYFLDNSKELKELVKICNKIKKAFMVGIIYEKLTKYGLIFNCLILTKKLIN